MAISKRHKLVHASQLLVLFIMTIHRTLINAFGNAPSAINRSVNHRSKFQGYILSSRLSMGLYEEDIDWDADLFGQIGKSGDANPTPAEDGDTTASKQLNNRSEEDGGEWDMEQSKTEVNSLREQMNDSWKFDEGKPSVDWVPRFESGPDEDEPWFTG